MPTQCLPLEPPDLQSCLDLPGEEGLSLPLWCAHCGAPILPEETTAYDAWDRIVHPACRPQMRLTARSEREKVGLSER